MRIAVIFLLTTIVTTAQTSSMLRQEYGQPTSASRSSAQGTLVQPSAARTVIVTVTDKNDAPVSALPATSFGITSKNLVQEIVDFKQADAPISVAIVFDLSGSMTNGRDGKPSKITQSALAALVRFVQSSNPSNEYFLIGFNDKVQLLHGRFQDGTAMIAELNSIGARSFRNGTALYDALQFAVNELSHSGFLKQTIILVTDSIDNSSKATFKDTIRSLEQTNALVYPILLLPEDYSDLSGGGPWAAETKAILKAFASLSGGKYIQAQRSQELNALVDRIAIELRSQYFVRVVLANNLEKKCYELKLKLISTNHPELKSSSLRTRKVLCVQ
jgi:Ca-activated chloride channel family protein